MTALLLNTLSRLLTNLNVSSLPNYLIVRLTKSWTDCILFTYEFMKIKLAIAASHYPLHSEPTSSIRME